MTLVHKRKLLHVLGEHVGGVFGALCDERSYRRRLHEDWGEVTCPKCLAVRAKFTHTPAGRTTAATDTTIVDALAKLTGSRGAPCPNCGQRHAAGSHGCTDGG